MPAKPDNELESNMSNTDRPLRILEISGSGRRTNSVTRELSADLISALEQQAGDVQIKHRDLSDGIPLVDEAWITANFTPAEERSAEQQQVLAKSDELVAELQHADVIVIGAPIYNFGVPAALKAWVDMIARARVTFRYTENGPEGLLLGKKAYVVVASGGIAVDSEVDFATPYLRLALRFLGVTDVEVIVAEQLNIAAEQSLHNARQKISVVASAAQAPASAVIH